MKLRDFVANSLPRVRGRKKKGPSPNGPAASITTTAAAAAVAVAASGATTTPASLSSSSSLSSTPRKQAGTADIVNPVSSPRASRPDGSGNNWFQFGETRFGSVLERLVGKESPVKKLFEARGRSSGAQTSASGPAREKEGGGGGSNGGAEKRERISRRQQHQQGRESSSRRRRTNSTSASEASAADVDDDCCRPYESVAVTSTCAYADCPCSEDVIPPTLDGYSTRCQAGGDLDSDSLYSALQGAAESVTSSCDVTSNYESTPGSQRGGPRSRSRIRTNPWLPSPRPSPYCLRSFSSPCGSSSSPSPSSSPAPPSSSSATNAYASPVTSQGSDVIESQRHRHHHFRRHRRHHSEVSADHFSRRFVADAPLTDTEQYYYSTLDSGIGETVTSPEERGNGRQTGSAPPRKHRVVNAKHRSSAERDCPPFFHSERSFNFNNSNFSSRSPSPKSRTPRARLRTKTSAATKGIVANRDSLFWDSDSSRSPPCVSKALVAKQGKSSPRFSDKDTGNSWDSDGSESFSHFQQRCEAATLGFSPRRCTPEKPPGNFGPETAVDTSLLYACEDICAITSNIEQLAQNISFEYEEDVDTSFDSVPDSTKRDKSCASLRELFNIDCQGREALVPSEARAAVSVDYSHVLGSFPFGEAKETQGRNLGTKSTTENTELGTSSNESIPTIDVAVQTDFADDEDDEEAEEENSCSDWLTSTESGSDWLTGNGSSSDWLTSNGSSSDWLAGVARGGDQVAGEGSGCATEEEVEVGAETGSEVSLAGEGRKMWMVPDVMHGSTDTGYSSLSRDGRIVTTECDSSSSSNHTNSDSSDFKARNSGDDSSDSVSASSNGKTAKCPANGGRSCSKSDDCYLEPLSLLDKSSTTSALRKQPELYSDSRETGVVYTFDFVNMDGNNFERNLFENSKELQYPESREQRSKYCSCNSDFSKETLVWREAETTQGTSDASQPIRGRHARQDSFVPYPYDVTRFCSDFGLSEESSVGSSSPCPPRAVYSRSDFKSKAEKECQPSSLYGSSTPPLQQKATAMDEFCTCFQSDSTVDNSESQLLMSDDLIPLLMSQSDDGSELSCLDSASGFAESPADQATSAEDLPSTGRSLSEVTASLEEKVLFLRQGKHVVNRKIREAREEEMVRQQQKLRFQRLLDIHRKQILLQTLRDLRQRLESQSARLQASYSTVLNIQKRYA